MRFKFQPHLIKFCLLVSVLVFSSGIALAQSEQRIKISSISTNINTGQDYSSWLNDDLNDMVPDNWNSANWQYTDVTLTLQQHSKITRLLLYDWQGVFDDNPATIYALNGQQKTLLATFTGDSYMVFDTVKLASAIDADAIIVHKYGNNIPQKIQVFGFPAAVATAQATSNTAASTPPLVKIPVDGSRWYQLNSASDGIAAMFDGDSTTAIPKEYGKIFQNYDAYYPVLPGEQIDLYKVKFYSNNADLGNQPLTLSVITADGKRIPVATFQGGQYGSWIGPYPGKWTNGDAEFMLDTPYKNIKYLVLNCWYDFPPEIELYGVYTAGAALTTAPKQGFKLGQYLGVNAFEWNFENPNAPDKIDTTLMQPARAFTQVRHYLDWRHLEEREGQYTFNPSPAGGWNYDALYQGLKAKNIEVVADIKTLPDYMLATYPDSLKDNENVPVKYGKDFSDPASYIEQARMAYQFAARYGANTGIDSTSISVAPVSQYPGGPVNVSKKSLGLVHYIECDNERDKWWKGRKAYQTAWEYAANLSAFYDGNKNTMGPGVGVKNADPSMKVVMGGLAYANTDYLKGMVDWCRQHRGYNADGSVNLCWDVINYHYYTTNGNGSQNGSSTSGAAPELSAAPTVAQQFVTAAHQYAADMPVWVTELGYDVNQGSLLKAPPIGSKTALQTQADWELRSALLYARTGVARTFFYEMYDDNPTSTIEFGSSGMVNADKTRKPVADYFYQVNQLLGNYIYQETLSSNPIVDRYAYNGRSVYVVVSPSQQGSTVSCTLNLPGFSTVNVGTPTVGASGLNMQNATITDGKLTLTATETPQFVLPVGQATDSAQAVVTATAIRSIPPVKLNLPQLNVYPNPAVNFVNVSFEPQAQTAVSIRVSDASSGKVYRRISGYAAAGQYAQLIDMSGLPNGVYLIEVKQSGTSTVKKIVKAGQ